ncbi:hypothetical protein [Humibacter albus]|jgi:hypothetical protein|uniref:hypothetical protein n=1 Tax=Humibacter albus TaxID=427754 RepID=UPI0003B5B354|nr:hypothetical protein [Humibacter albus]
MTQSDYLQYDGASEAHAIDDRGTLAYLETLGITGGALQRARTAVGAGRAARFEFEDGDARYCDFCFVRLTGGEYDRLADGRERCVRCSRTVLSTGSEFTDVFHKVRTNLEVAFDVTVRAPAVVRMVNAKEIARRSGERFQPTPGVDARVLGFAERSRSGFRLYLENGSPKLAAIATLAHELTHVWQYTHWNERAVLARYGKRNRLPVYEGMATWVQIQYLFCIAETGFAERQEAYALQRTDEYGVGYRWFLDAYPLRRDGDVRHATPFHQQLPL